jgi:cytidylate kinase
MLGGGRKEHDMATAMSSDIVEIEEAPWARWLVASKAAARIWLVARVWLGYEWLDRRIGGHDSDVPTLGLLTLIALYAFSARNYGRKS